MVQWVYGRYKIKPRNMDTDVLIKWLERIDHKLKNMFYEEQKSFIGRFTGEEMKLPPITRCRYDPEEITDMHSQKTEIIMELNKRGIIDDKGYKEYLLSEDPTFTPKFILEQKEK